MNRLLTIAALTALTMIVTAQDKPALSKVVADLRQSIAQSQAQLRKFSWTETKEISLKGELKKREQFDCHYDAAGNLQCAPLAGPAEPQKAPKGLKGKMVANKLEDLKEYMDRVGSLVRRYVPPSPDAMKAAFEAGKASFNQPSGGSLASLLFRDYAKPGDQVTVLVDLNTKKLRSFQVATYLDSSSDLVRLDATFSSLPNGPSFLEQSVLHATAKEIEIKTINFGHR